MVDPDRFRVIQGGTHGDDHRLATNAEADMRAEVAVLSAVMADPLTLDSVSPFLRAEHFHSEAHRRIFEACIALQAVGAPIDSVAVATWLRDQDRLVQVGGSPVITEILSAGPATTTAQTVAHARHVRDRFVRRELAAALVHAKVRCDAGPESIEELIGGLQVRFDALAATLHESEESCHVRDLLGNVFTDLQSDGTAGKPKVRSGFDGLDHVTAGLPVQLRVLAARPGMGKTSLACQMAIEVARQDRGVFIASMETTRLDLLKRILCAESGVSAQRVKLGTLTADDWQNLTAAATRLAPLDLWIDDDPGLTVAALWAKARRTQLHLRSAGRALGLVVVDYLQLIRPPRAGMRREEVVAENARALRAMAMDLGVCTLALAQLNRECEKRDDKRPQLADRRQLFLPVSDN